MGVTPIVRPSRRKRRLLSVADIHPATRNGWNWSAADSLGRAHPLAASDQGFDHLQGYRQPACGANPARSHQDREHRPGRNRNLTTPAPRRPVRGRPVRAVPACRFEDAWDLPAIPDGDGERLLSGGSGRSGVGRSGAPNASCPEADGVIGALPSRGGGCFSRMVQRGPCTATTMRRSNHEVLCRTGRIVGRDGDLHCR